MSLLRVAAVSPFIAALFMIACSSEPGDENGGTPDSDKDAGADVRVPTPSNNNNNNNNADAGPDSSVAVTCKPQDDGFEPEPVDAKPFQAGACTEAELQEIDRCVKPSPAADCAELKVSAACKACADIAAPQESQPSAQNSGRSPETFGCLENVEKGAGQLWSDFFTCRISACDHCEDTEFKSCFDKTVNVKACVDIYKEFDTKYKANSKLTTCLPEKATAVDQISRQIIKLWCGPAAAAQ